MTTSPPGPRDTATPAAQRSPGTADGRLLPRGGRYLMVASTGGHLAQLNLIDGLLGARSDSHWVTFPTPQSETLMAERSHTLVPYVGPRQLGRTIRTVPTFLRLLRRGRYDAVISTGAAVAVPALLCALATRTPAVYLESISRVYGPSLTGRIMRAVPGITTFTQHPTWRGGGWHHDISVLDAFSPADAVASIPRPRTGGATHDGPRVFVSLGTIRPYRFDQLVDGVLAAITGRGVHVVWQLGATERDDLPGTVHQEMSVSDFEAEASRADVVITHAGVATCLRLPQLGIHPVVVPRRSARDEHVDDHQEQITEELARRGLCTACEATDLAEVLRRRLDELEGDLADV